MEIKCLDCGEIIEGRTDKKFCNLYCKSSYHYKKNKDYLQGQIGNPDGNDKPNKKYYDPRAWMRKGEESIVERLKIAFEDLNCINRS